MAEEPDPRAFRVVLVDPQPERPQVMRHVVERSALAATVIAEADNKAGAVELLERSDAELVVLEIQPVEEGLDTIAALHSRWPRLRIVVCSFHRDEATKRRALDLGAGAYLDKPVGPAELTAVLRELFADATAALRVPATTASVATTPQRFEAASA